MYFFTRKIYLKDIEIQTESTSIVYMCFIFHNYLNDYGGHTDEQNVKVPVLQEIFNNLEDAKIWKEMQEKREYRSVVRKIDINSVFIQFPTTIEYFHDDYEEENCDDF